MAGQRYRVAGYFFRRYETIASGEAHMRIFLTASLAMTLLATAAAGEPSQDHAWCVGKEGTTPDQQIGGCTALIEGGSVSNHNLASYYSNRGNGYQAKRQLDRAITDYDQAIKLDPNFAGAYNNRGNAYRAKQETDRAIADYNRALELNPKFALAFRNRGNTFFDLTRYDRAIEDYDQAIKCEPNNAPAFFSRASAIRTKRAGISKPTSTRADISRWPSRITISRSGSIPRMQAHSTIGAISTGQCASTGALSRTTMRRSGSIRTMSKPTSIAQSHSVIWHSASARSPTTERHSP
jgi:tetratricopeptide (TPR) repeat protein